MALLLPNCIRGLLVIALTIMVSGCETTDKQLQQAGKSDTYIVGFHDGRHSGMKEAGNYLDHFVQDAERFENDAEYRAGWLAGEEEGKRIQKQANIGVGVLGGMKAAKEAKHTTPDAQAIGRDAMKGVDTSTLNQLK